MKHSWLILLAGSSSSFGAENPAAEFSSSALAGQLVFGLLLVSVLIFVLAWLAKKLNFPHLSSSKYIQVISSTPLGRTERLVVVEVSGERLLLGVTNTSINLLKKIDGAETGGEAVEAELSVSSKNKDFSRFLGDLIAGKNPNRAHE